MPPIFTETNNLWYNFSAMKTQLKTKSFSYSFSSFAPLASFAFIALAASAALAASDIEFKVERNIPYYPPDKMASAGDYQKARCLLDVKWPVGATNFPTLVNFHGGGLVHGNKHFAPWPEGPAEPVAFVGVGYRLLTNATPAECLSDAGAAVSWVLDNISRYGGDPKKVFVTGISGGGYITGMVGMDARWLAPWGHRPGELAGIAPLTGQMTKHFNVRKVSFKDKDPQFAPKIDEWSPLFYAGAKDLPPASFLGGGRDLEWKCRVEENELLAASMRNCGYPNTEFHETEGSHGGGVKPSTYFLRDFVVKHSGIGLWRFADKERAAVRGAADAPAVAAALQLFQCLRHPGCGVSIYAGQPKDGVREIVLEENGPAGAYARAARVFELMREWPMVAQASVDAKTGYVWQRSNGKKKPETMNAVVTSVRVRPDGIAFSYAPKSLPLPAGDALDAACAAAPFLAQMNRENITVIGLPPGEYAFSFDGREIGRFSAEAFEKGVDVAALDTPNQRLAHSAAAIAESLVSATGEEACELRERLNTLRPVVSRVLISRK